MNLSYSPFINSSYKYVIFCLLSLTACQDKEVPASIPDIYQQSGAFVNSLPYYNPDSCTLLIKSTVPKKWQGAVYENLFLDGPEDSSIELGFAHLENYEKEFPADTARIFAQLWRGHLYLIQQKFDSAELCLKTSYDISIKLGKHLRAGDAQNKLAELHLRQGNVARAIRSYLAVFNAVEHLSSAQNLRKQEAALRLSLAYNQSDNHQEALYWINKAMSYVADENIPSFREKQVKCYNVKSRICRNLNMPDSAIIMAQKGLQLQEKYQTIDDKANLLSTLAMAHYAKGDCATALQIQTEAQSLNQSKLPFLKEAINENMGDIYYCLHQLDAAESIFKKILHSPLPMRVYNANLSLGDIYEKQGRYKEALEVYTTGWNLREKHYNARKMQEAGAAKAELELQEEKYRAIQSKQDNLIKQQRIRAWLFAALLGLLFALFFVFYLRNKRQVLEREKELISAREKLQTVELKIAKQKLKESAQLLLIKDEMIRELEMSVDTKNSPSASESTKEAKEVLRSMKILTDKQWKEFQESFDKHFYGYKDKIEQEFSAITPAETRLFMLTKLQFSVKEIAEMLGISDASVYRSRHRLGKKVGLKNTNALNEFVEQF